MATVRKPLALIILDGWGHREDTDNNAIANANTPVLDTLYATVPNSLISGSGLDVGLPEGQMGNSEVGHVNLGAGRVVYQDFTRITKAIADGDFFTNPTLVNAIDSAKAAGGALHLMGLLSPGGVHSHQEHFFAALSLAAKRGLSRVYVHAFLDGRDTPPRSAEGFLAALESAMAETGVGRVASLVGRYFAMDRDNRWDRIQQAYDMLTLGESEFTAASAEQGLKEAYARDENDEFVRPVVIGESVPIQDGDSVVFMNFRADRGRQLSRAFVEPDFAGFERRSTPAISTFVTLTEYAADIPSDVAYPPEALNNVMGQWLADHGKTQLRISETEKYAHVTFFYSGGREELFEGEERILVPSPDVATYDLQPEMNAYLLTDKLVEAIESGKHDVIVCNYPNGDMVGHTGNYDAAVKAVEAVDTCLGRVVEALRKVGGECLITADHGNAEQMVDPETGENHTAHTSELVPFIYVGRDASMRSGGTLSDVAPTMLNLMGMAQPEEMTGKTIVNLDS